MRYPAECPVFEVVGTKSFCHSLKIGEVVQGEGFNPCAGSVDCYPVDRAAGDGGATWRFGQHVSADELRPLTRAAREMLALVRE